MLKVVMLRVSWLQTFLPSATKYPGLLGPFVICKLRRKWSVVNTAPGFLFYFLDSLIPLGKQ